MGSKYNNFNVLRLMAALQVVYNHTVEHLYISNNIILYIKDVIAYFPGVPIFFLISGYLITMSYEKNQNIYTYIRNRILRIFPGLYVSFLIGLIILLYFNQFTNITTLKVLIWVFAQLTIFQFYNPEFIRDFGVGVINGSLWTISVELTFYFLLPFIYVFLQKKFFRNFFILLFISFSFYYYVFYISLEEEVYEKLIKVSLFPYLFYFLFGLIFYKYQDYLEKYIGNKVLVYFFLYIVVLKLHVNIFLYDIFQYIIFSFFIFSFAFSFKTFSFRLMGNNDFTYGIYIYHMLIVNTFIELNYKGEIINLFMVLLLSICFGVLSYFLVEKPFLNMKKRSLYNQINK